MYNTLEFVLFQKRFMLANVSDTEQNLWWIPLTFTNMPQPDFYNTTPSHWLHKTSHLEIPIEAEQNHWVIFNIQETGINSSSEYGL